MTTLKREMAAYEKIRNDLELEHFGKWAVVHDEELVGVYDDFEVAADNAVRRYGRGPYLIRRIGGTRAITLPASIQYRPVYADD